MAISRTGARASQLRVCLDAAADAARLTQLERSQLWRRQILSPFIFCGWSESA